jgi:hypothetical protein
MSVALASERWERPRAWRGPRNGTVRLAAAPFGGRRLPELDRVLTLRVHRLAEPSHPEALHHGSGRGVVGVVDPDEGGAKTSPEEPFDLGRGRFGCVPPVLVRLEDSPPDVGSRHCLWAPDGSSEPDGADHGSVKELRDERTKAVVVPCRDRTLEVSRALVSSVWEPGVDVAHQLGIGVDPHHDADVVAADRPQHEPARPQLHNLERNRRLIFVPRRSS